MIRSGNDQEEPLFSNAQKRGGEMEGEAESGEKGRKIGKGKGRKWKGKAERGKG